MVRGTLTGAPPPGGFTVSDPETPDVTGSSSLSRTFAATRPSGETLHVSSAASVLSVTALSAEPGLFSPNSDGKLDSSLVRYEVAASLLQFKDLSGVPVLIGFLEDEDRRIRFKSFQALSAFTRQDFGYEFGSDYAFFFAIFAQVSASVTERLKTGSPGFESLMSAQKYPRRSNW